MEATVTDDSHGVLTLLAGLRQELGLKSDDPLIAETTAEGLLPRTAVTLPVDFYTSECGREFDAAEPGLANVLAAPAPAERPRRRSRATCA